MNWVEHMDDEKPLLTSSFFISRAFVSDYLHRVLRLLSSSVAMAPKKMSSVGSSDGQNAGGYENITINLDEMTEEVMFQFIHAPDFMSQMASSSDPTLKEVLKFLEQKLQDYYGKMKATKGEISKRTKEEKKFMSKAVAAEKAEAVKAEKAMKRQAKKTITVLFNGQSFNMALSGSTTVGSLRKRLINMWNDANPTKTIAMAQCFNIAVHHGVEKLHLKPRATLMTFGLNDDMLLHAASMTDADDDVGSSILDDEENICESEDDEEDEQ